MSFVELGHRTDEPSQGRAAVGANARHQSRRQQQANSRLVVRGPGRVDEAIWGEAAFQQSRVTNLLQGDDVERQGSAPLKERWQLALESEADVERAQLKLARRGRMNGFFFFSN